LKPEWIRKWDQSLLPVYFVIVVVPRKEHVWLDHPISQTVHRTAAFWKRIETGMLGSSISVPKSQRLTAATLARWHTDLIAAFSPGQSK